MLSFSTVLPVLLSSTQFLKLKDFDHNFDHDKLNGLSEKCSL